ncbi:MULTISPECIES: beta-ketoacyl-[acyl-carrier-protein] synthase family protein [unclassified Crossiella]|uniref:beta-ketoacyl-[acyl-carrier-protein] synthase family protein n=1 Tax=unclassified Crossiella TaxID=2620835 RepID=UPI001FFFDB85|nr:MULTISPECIES: beta-ketoacyl-[acyl-carrier-protein] synthase family protein [unclassified Crossiella]MCK2236910.1 beta-ketoacyl-[acyl-carrier-protein] synthase family protein [Crossiella sp. S99.2]MCK2250578.1 beta-ketoacyl-[acyl-carrier-protein] synthase family protein [Crossiella sp. S99.1]
MTGRRVAITGIGVVSSIGIGAGAFRDGLRAGRSGARPITAFDTTGFDRTMGCEVTGFEAADWLRVVDPAALGRAGQFAAAAATMAVRDAGADLDRLRAGHGLISMGTTDGGAPTLERLVAADLAAEHGHRDPLLAAQVPAARLGLDIATELGLREVELCTLGTACSAGNYAIGNGFDAIRSGEADFALCGGADAMCRLTFTSFYRLGTISPDVCRPFDADRQGILTGEGAAVLLLEPWESAVARGARIYAELLGYGLSCDAYHQVAPERAGIALGMTRALANAGIAPAQVDLISAHGTGTKANDVTETAAIREVFGEHPPRTVSLKSMLGHTMGAATALSVAACALAITEGFIPPTINHRVTDPECPIDCVPNTAVPARLRVVQSNGLAFGGNNAIVLLGAAA